MRQAQRRAIVNKLAGQVHRFLPAALGAALPWLLPVATFAASDDDEANKVYDGRILNYAKNMQLDVGGTALVWLLLILLAGLCVAVLFKNPNRSHLD